MSTSTPEWTHSLSLYGSTEKLFENFKSYFGLTKSWHSLVLLPKISFHKMKEFPTPKHTHTHTYTQVTEEVDGRHDVRQYLKRKLERRKRIKMFVIKVEEKRKRKIKRKMRENKVGFWRLIFPIVWCCCSIRHSPIKCWWFEFSFDQIISCVSTEIPKKDCTSGVINIFIYQKMCH